MINHTTLAIVAMVAALGLLGVVAIESIISIILQQQQAFALTNGTRLPGCTSGSTGDSASQGRCANHVVIPP